MKPSHATKVLSCLSALPLSPRLFAQDRPRIFDNFDDRPRRSGFPDRIHPASTAAKRARNCLRIKLLREISSSFKRLFRRKECSRRMGVTEGLADRERLRPAYNSVAMSGNSQDEGLYNRRRYDRLIHRRFEPSIRHRSAADLLADASGIVIQAACDVQQGCERPDAAYARDGPPTRRDEHLRPQTEYRRAASNICGCCSICSART